MSGASLGSRVTIGVSETFWHLGQPLLGLLEEFAPTDGRSADVQNVLEVGCGSGKLSAILAIKRRNWCFTATDVDETALAVASRVVATAGAVVGERLNVAIGKQDARNMRDFRNREFDVCFSEGVLNLFAPPEQRKVLGEMLRVADVVVAITPNGRNEQVKQKYRAGAARAEWGYAQDPEALLGSLREGLANQQVDMEVVYPFSGDKDADRQFLLSARWKRRREAVL